MKKMFFMAAVAALALSSCSSDDLVQAPEVNGAEDGAVVFSAQTLRANRAYNEKNITNITDLQDPKAGFGVFAYAQERASFSTFSANTSYPNFMYNQTVNWNGSSSKWEYSPIKYYSNNEGAKHSFFAYAPARGEGATPVFALGKAPQMRYNVREDYDLLWADPVLDKEKAGITEIINFNFKHALSKVTFQVAPFIDAVHGTHGPATSPKLAAGTKVTVKSIRFVGNVPSQALLNLHDGKWTIENTQEGEYLVDVTPLMWTAQKDDDTNGAWDSDVAITAYEKANNEIKVIPSTGVKIEIVYDVETMPAPESQSNNSKITNTVVSKEEFTLEGGKAYTFNLDLGLTSVKFDAAMTDWADGGKNTTDLPNNHDFHAMSYVALDDQPTKMEEFEAAAPAEDNTTANKYYFNNGILYYCTTVASSPAKAVYDIVKDGKAYYEADGKVYVTTTDGNCAVYDAWKVSDSYYVGKISPAIKTTSLISLTPNSDGEVQQTDGEWVKPTKDNYYTVGSFLYVAKFFAPPTSSNRR